jgi:hypothetical protein
VNKTPRKPNRYNVLQGILSSYGKEHNVKWAKGEFAKKCSVLSEKTKGYDLKFVAQNIDVLYKDFVDDGIKKKFPSGENFAWWNFLDEIKMPIFDNVEITFRFDDGFQEFGFSGNSDEAELFWNEKCYRYFRVHYSESPWAYFQIEEDEKGKQKTDNKTYVDYVIIPGARQEQGAQKQPSTPTLPTQPSTIPTTDKLIALEREKQATMDRVIELTKLGFTKDEIFKIIGK